MDKLSVDDLKTALGNDSNIILRDIAWKQIEDTMRENERLNKWLLSHGYDEVCSKDYANKESDNAK